MPWFAVDDSIGDHPKWRRVMEERCWPDCLALWTLAGAHSSKHLTDGAVPFWKLLQLGPMTPKRVKRAAQILVDAKLWKIQNDSKTAIDLESKVTSNCTLVFHQWGDRNPTKAQVETKRKLKSKRTAEWRANKRNDSEPPPNVDVPQDAPRDAPQDASRDAPRTLPQDASRDAPRTPATPNPYPLTPFGAPPAAAVDLNGAEPRGALSEAAAAPSGECEFDATAVVIADAIGNVPKFAQAFGSEDLRNVGTDMFGVLMGRKVIPEADQLAQAVREAAASLPSATNERAARDAIRIQLQRMAKHASSSLTAGASGGGAPQGSRMRPGTYKQTQPETMPWTE